MRLLRCVMIFIVCAGWGAGRLPAQDNLRTELFREADALSREAISKHADLLAPRTYRRASEYYKDAEDAFRNEKKIEDIREKVKNAAGYFAKSIDAVHIAERIFNTVMIARDDARTAGAPASEPDLWKDAETRFDQSARSLEDGDSTSVKARAPSVELAYRTAELEAIKATYLTPARLLLKQAAESKVGDYAPATLEKATALVAQVERLLQQNRRDADQARALAGEAKYEAAHAIALSKVVRQMRADESRMEPVLLADEAQITRLCTALGVQPDFENGTDAAVTEMLSVISDKDRRLSSYTDSLRRLSDIVTAKDSEAANLTQQIASMQTRLGTLTDNERELQHKLTVQHDQEMTVKNVAATFTSEEGSVLRDGDNVIIRLYALTFASGKSDIEPQYYPLLTRVQDAIRKFGNCKVKIEGHTDSKGNERINQTLSEARARAVAEYLMANMGVSVAIPSEGFGDTRPVATNNTVEGRAKNRRIDVVITPEWAAK